MNRIKIAIPKNGRLHNDTLKCFTEAGFEFKKDNTGFQLQCVNGDFDLVLMREKDIPMLVEHKILQNGICGENSFYEYDWNNFSGISILYNFTFGKCRISIAGKTYLTMEDLKGLNVVTSYSNISAGVGIQARFINMFGSVGHTIELGIADAIIDIVETGETLRKSGLVEGETLMHSQAVLIGSNSDVIKDILFKIEATENAKNKKYVMLNCEKKSIELICHYLPSKTPTILPLVQDDMVAIHALCDEKDLFKVLKTLSKIGAKDIIITSPEKVI